MVVILMIEAAAAAGIAVWKYRMKERPEPVKKEKEAVIEGDKVASPKTNDNKEDSTEQEAEEASEKEQPKKTSAASGKKAKKTKQKAKTVEQTGVMELQALLENLVSTEYGAGGSVSVCVGRVNENDMAFTGGGRMQAASLIKLYVAGCAYENYESVRAHESYDGEAESLLSVMITVSDNTACNTLVTWLGDGNVQAGMNKVNQYCEEHGFSETHMGRLMLQPNDVDDNYTSVRDCCMYLKMAYAGQLEGGSAVLEYMKQQQRRSKIPAGLPSGVTVGNKTGELSNVENDAAIVYADNGPYVLCVMSENLADTYSAQQFIARVSSAVYESM